jgi:hypothetical protein
MSLKYHEKHIDQDVEEERREHGARVVIGPKADLNGDDHGSIEQEDGAQDEHACAQRHWV